MTQISLITNCFGELGFPNLLVHSDRHLGLIWSSISRNPDGMGTEKLTEGDVIFDLLGSILGFGIVPSSVLNVGI